MKPLTPRRWCTQVAGAMALLALLLLISPGVGSELSSISWGDAWRARLGLTIEPSELTGRPLVDIDGNGVITAEERDAFVRIARAIGFDQRFSRSLLALQVGATLGLCGATFQILFRNVLATPYTLGIASGGSLGALIALRAGWVAAFAGISSTAIAAFAGALVVVAAVFTFARGSRRLTSNEMLLAGVTLGLFCSAMMMFVTAVSSERETFFIVRWMMGSLDPIRGIEGATLLPMLLPAWVGLVALSRALNQYRLGDDWAAGRGVNVTALQIGCVVLCSLATAGVVAFCGPIGFVGLVVPHVVHLLFGSDTRILLPASALFGAAFLVVCDWASQLSLRAAGWLMGKDLGSATLPIGVVTAILGVPVFLFLLRARTRRGHFTPGE